MRRCQKCDLTQELLLRWQCHSAAGILCGQGQGCADEYQRYDRQLLRFYRSALRASGHWLLSPPDFPALNLCGTGCLYLKRYRAKPKVLETKLAEPNLAGINRRNRIRQGALSFVHLQLSRRA